MGWYPLLNYAKNSFTLVAIGSTTAVKSRRLGGNVDTFMFIFSANTNQN